MKLLRKKIFLGFLSKVEKARTNEKISLHTLHEGKNQNGPILDIRKKSLTLPNPSS